MKSLVQITTQYFENYSDIDTPFWKAKGVHKFNLLADSDNSSLANSILNFILSSS